MSLPIRGFLQPFRQLAHQPIPDDRALSPSLACVPPLHSSTRYVIPSEPFTVALIERGGCDFATKVRAAQERGAGAVVVGDGMASQGETLEEGRARENLITMFSPGL